MTAHLDTPRVCVRGEVSAAPTLQALDVEEEEARGRLGTLVFDDPADGRADVMSAPAAPAIPVIAATGDGTATIEE